MASEQRILDAAEQLIFERGFDGVGVDAIGELAGVSGSAIYRHFDGKNELLAVLFDQAIDALLLRMREPKSDPDEELRQLIRVHVEFADQHPRLAAIWVREQRSLAEPYRRAYRRRQQRYLDRWWDCFAARFPLQPRDRVNAAMRAVHALILSDATRPIRSSSPRDVDDLLVEMALASLSVLDVAAQAPRSIPRRTG